MNVAYPEGVRAKYAASWQMYCHHYPNLTTQLVASGNDVCSIAPLVGWQAVIDRHPEDYSYAIKTRVEF
jgi:hypothetical protein